MEFLERLFEWLSFTFTSFTEEFPGFSLLLLFFAALGSYAYNIESKQSNKPQIIPSEQPKKRTSSKELKTQALEPLKLYVIDREASFDIQVKGVLKIPNENIKQLQFALMIYDITENKTIINSLIVDETRSMDKSNLISNAKILEHYMFVKDFKVNPDQTLKFISPRLLVSLFKGDLDYVRQGKMKLLFELTISELSKPTLSSEKVYSKKLTSQRSTSIQFKDYPKLQSKKKHPQRALVTSAPQTKYCSSCETPLRPSVSYCHKCGRPVDDLAGVTMNHVKTREVSMFLEGYGVFFQYRFVTSKVADIILKHVKREEFTDVFDEIDLVQVGLSAIQRLTSLSIKGEVGEDNWLHSFEGVFSLTFKSGQEEVELEPSIPYKAHHEYPVGKIMLDACLNPEEFPYVIVYRSGGGMDIDQKIEIDAFIDSLEDLEDRNIKMDNLHLSIYDGPPIYLDNYEFNELVHDAFMILRLVDLEGVTINNIMNKAIYWNEISQ
jgi:hypothetical protein